MIVSFCCKLIFVVPITMHASSYLWCYHDACFLIFVVPITMHASSYLWCQSRFMLPHICGADHDACFLIFVVRSRCMLPHICGAITMHASSYSWCDHNAGFLIFMVPITMHAFSYLWCDHNACFLIIIVSYVHTGKKTFCLAFQMLFSLNPFARSHFRPTFDCYYSFPLLLVVDEWSVPCVLCV